MGQYESFMARFHSKSFDGGGNWRIQQTQDEHSNTTQNPGTDFMHQRHNISLCKTIKLFSDQS